MTLKEVSSVIDDINKWDGPNGTVYYVTAMFTDETVGSVGRKDHDAALEVQGLLREAIGIEQDFTLESKGQTKTGRDKFNIKGFGTPGGAATYTAPGVQGGGGSGAASPASRGSRSPEQIDDIRRAVALKAAAAFIGHDIGTSPQDVLKFADIFLEWLSSEPALGAYESVEGSPSPPQAGAGSEDRGEEVGGVTDDHLGEGTPASTPHEHDWQMRQGVKGFLVCDGCGKTRKKETAAT
jgi:hypothetical protein